MPKGTSKGKRKGKKKGKSPANKNAVPQAQCLTLEEDTEDCQERRCINPPTHGTPPERCEVHHRQYRKMTQRYKEASKIVDDILKQSNMPTEAEISNYTDYHRAADKARWIRRYVEAIRVEKIGREVHQKRFFPKADDGHKIRIKLLAKHMVAAVELLDAVQAKAAELWMLNRPENEWIKCFPASPLASGSISNSQVNAPTEPPSKDVTQSDGLFSCGDEDDLIEIEMRAEKAKLLYVLEPILDFEAVMRDKTEEKLDDPDLIRLSAITRTTSLQYARRIIFYDSGLFQKALNKVSFKDLILDPNFSIGDLENFFALWEKRMGIGLLWWKDATLEAFSMVSSTGQVGNAANIGDPKDRILVLGDWIFNRRHKQTMTNEHWWHLIKSTNPPANIEYRFVRLCNNFDDLHSFLSFGALGMIDPPKFCIDSDRQGRDSKASRNHLSLCGVVITDMVSPKLMEVPVLGPVPSKLPASRPGCITWVEHEFRAYMFGAIRNEPDQFTKAFLDELRARPDLFHVIIHSETEPYRQVECLGGSPNEPLSQIRFRKFEEPFALFDNRPLGRGKWTVLRSALDVLYGVDLPGYFTMLNRPDSAGWFFHFKQFPVKYLLILDATPGRHVHHISRQVAWAALRALKLAQGEYDVKKYIRASNILFQKHASERLAWMPKGYGEWHATTMEE